LTARSGGPTIGARERTIATSRRRETRAARLLKSPLRSAARRWRYLPSASKAPVWRAVFAPLDALDRVRGAGGGLPPRWLRFLVGDNYEGVGREFLGLFQRLGHLGPDDAVLDIGCGAGRMALPLTTLLSARGSYDGFDIVPAAVAWCTRNIGRRHANFRFRTLDVRNDRYNPRGALAAHEVTFPYPDASFDFAFASSVFTHLGPAEARRYLAEARRVLRPGGRLLATFFLVDPEARALMAAAAGSLAFRETAPGVHTLLHRAGDVHFAVAVDEDLARAWLAEAGLRVHEPVHRGAWCGRAEHVSYQDIVVASPSG